MITIIRYFTLAMLLLVLCANIFQLVVPVNAQQKERTIESYKLQLKAVQISRDQCEVNLADIWEQAEQAMKEIKQLKDKQNEKDIVSSVPATNLLQ